MSDKTWVFISEIPIEWREEFLSNSRVDCISVRGMFRICGPSEEKKTAWDAEYIEILRTYYGGNYKCDLPNDHRDKWIAEKQRVTRFGAWPATLAYLNKVHVPIEDRSIPDIPADVFDEIDFSTSSRRYEDGPKNMHGQRMGLSITRIEFDYDAARDFGLPPIPSVEEDRRGADDLSESTTAVDGDEVVTNLSLDEAKVFATEHFRQYGKIGRAQGSLSHAAKECFPRRQFKRELMQDAVNELRAEGVLPPARNRR